jgi:hypothetical protein
MKKGPKLLSKAEKPVVAGKPIKGKPGKMVTKK